MGSALMLAALLFLQQAPPVKKEEYKPRIPSENAFDYYLVALERFKKETEPPQYPQPPDAASLAHLKANDQALSILYDGVKKNYWLPYDTDMMDTSTLFPELASFRSISRLIQIQLRNDFATGDGFDAAKHYLNALKFAQDIQRGIMIQYLVGIACEATLLPPIAEHIDYFSAKECRYLVDELSKRDDSTNILKQVYQHEKMLTDKAMEDMFDEIEKDPSSLNPLIEYEMDEKDKADPERVKEYERYQKLKAKLLDELKTPGGFTRFKQRVKAYSNARFESILNALGKPAWEWNIAFEKEENMEDPAQVLAAQTSITIMPRQLQIFAQRQLLILHLALRAYKLKNGNYPQTLEELKLDSRLSIDPFTGKPFMYRLTGGGYQIYSVGPDGVDDNGTARDAPDGTVREKYDVFLLRNGQR